MKEREREGKICVMMIKNRWFSFLSFFLGSVRLSGKKGERKGGKRIKNDGKDGREK